MNRLTILTLFAVVTVLMMVQVPLDVRTHRLSRWATTWASVAVTIVIMVNAWTNRAFVPVAVSVMAAVVVVGVYGLLHGISPRSLGWGDVLLVAPLTLAVAYVAVERVLWWQLMASTTGAMHAVWVRARSGGSHVPFGPHLLGAAWLVLALST